MEMMVLDNVNTWPAALLEYLSSQYDMLHAHARFKTEHSITEYDQSGKYIPGPFRPENPHSDNWDRATRQVLELVQSTTLRGWHCTRLTENEVEHIQSHGMQMPSLQVLTQRVRHLQVNGIFDDVIADRLISENQAGEANRKGRLFFCFFVPRIGLQCGIECFFRSWGGEALSNSHGPNTSTGKMLRMIGRPCLIQVDVPISSCVYKLYLGEKIIRRYLVSRGMNIEVEKHEDLTLVPIPAANIVRFVFQGKPEFAALTGCDDWEPPLGIPVTPDHHFKNR